VLESFTPSDLRQAGIGAFFRPRDVLPLGVTYYQIQRLVAEGHAEKAGPGLYRLSDVEATETETIAMVASAVPHAIVCLLSALRVHEIGTQSPRQVWLAIDRKARKPGRLPAAVSIVRFSGQMLTGVVTSVAPLPDANTRFRTDRKVYTTKVTIAEGLPGLRPGMTAEVLVSGRLNVQPLATTGSPT